MKRSLLFCFLVAAGLSAKANSLLSSPVSGALGHGRIAAMSIASNGADAVLLLADGTSLYAVDIADNDASAIGANAITSIPDFVNTKLRPVAGGATLKIIDIEVNPISRAVYVLAEASGTSYVFQVRDNGSTVTLLDLSDISHSTISWGGTFSVNDMTWGDANLYASSGGFSLDGSVATVPAPFENGTSVTQRATSMFKSNWGGSYFTTAPLETMTYGVVSGTPRLMGVTTCAPGYSMEVSGLSGSGTLEVTEDFNINMGVSEKVGFMHHDSKDWLFDLHDNKIYRIGQSLIDGSPVTSGNYNNTSLELRGMTGAPASGITTDQLRVVAGTFDMMSVWDDYRLLVLETGGTLRLMQVAASAPGLSVDELTADNKLQVYPNPAHQTLNVTLDGTATAATLQVFSMDGRLVQTTTASGKTTAINISGLAAGQYLLKAVAAGTFSGQHLFVVQ